MNTTHYINKNRRLKITHCIPSMLLVGEFIALQERRRLFFISYWSTISFYHVSNTDYLPLHEIHKMLEEQARIT